MILKSHHITKEKFREMLSEETAKHNKQNKESKAIPEPYFKFAYYLAEKFLIPHDYYLSIVECMVSWLGIWSSRGGKYYDNPTKENYLEFVHKMLLSNSGWKSEDPNPQKYFVQSQIETYIDAVMAMM